MKEKVSGIIAPGDSVVDALDALQRLTQRAKLRALVARRRYERDKSQVNEHNYMLSAQEFYYISALSADFGKAARESLAQALHDVNEKKNNLN